MILVGDAGVGKTCFLNSYRKGEFAERYKATLGVEVHDLPFSTNFGQIYFRCWDISGQVKLGGPSDHYYFQGNAAIIMFDVTSRPTYKNVQNWHTELVRVCGNIPVVLLGNKVDARDRQVEARDITYLRKKSLQFYDVSAKRNFDQKPFLYLAKRLTGQPVKFISDSEVFPPDFEMPSDLASKLEAELDEAFNLPLPMDGDD